MIADRLPTLAVQWHVGAMRRSVPILLLLLAAAAPLPNRHDALMDEIERTVRLPKSANPLSSYGKSYAFAKPGKVMAIYLIPEPLHDPSLGCAVITEDLGSRPCTSQEIKESRDRDARSVADQVGAGKRRWLDDPRDLPDISDGGCTQITIEYDVASKRFLHVACNGLA
ncbi:MAG: hypothetical protein JWN66_5018 [Sphingomonas bacterium]|uniref:hypothetical protein n=1 Tax=Sphingomonas bacterium TaxID=1895847 RepID=UPI002628CD60|nr:hypothetical protein [Sphingomonas bacterium]MDB5707902.1 hypothetical protein [Sphingomonas bacterium]